MIESTTNKINEFWNTEACGTHFITDAEDEKQFFEQYTKFRYETEWHIPLYIPFTEFKNKKILEIGCGNGADGVMFARNGGIYTGVDITHAAIKATSRHFELLGLKGNFQIENAENLSFKDNSFDLVYSYGVLHHTKNPKNAFQEVYRVLKTDGKAILMLYHKNSFNYYVRIMGYMRIRLIFKIFKEKLLSRKHLINKPINGIRGNQTNKNWDIHYQNFLRYGWKYLVPSNFVHHCTDGPECPFAYVYTKKDIKQELKMFSDVQFKVVHFPLNKYKLGKLIPRKIEEYLSSKFGFYLLIFAKK